MRVARANGSKASVDGRAFPRSMRAILPAEHADDEAPKFVGATACNGAPINGSSPAQHCEIERERGRGHRRLPRFRAAAHPDTPVLTDGSTLAWVPNALPLE